MQGTIPYLGTFLTDLVMMDTAMKDYTEVRRFTSLHAFIALPVSLTRFFPLFSGRSDQLWEEKKGEGKQLCEDYVRIHIVEIKSF